MQGGQQQQQQFKDDEHTTNFQIQGSSYLKRFKLEFVKEKVEYSYYCNSVEQNRKFSYLISSAVVIYCIVIGIVSFFFFDDARGAIINFVFSFVNIILVYNIKNHYIIISKILFFSYITYEVIIMETFIIIRMEKNARSEDLQGYYFTIGLLIMSLVYAFAAAVHKWYFKTIIVEFALIYFSVRTNKPHYNTYTQYPIFYVSVFLFGIIFYMKEKFDRSVFYKLYLNREENKAFKDLLENTVPSSIFVAKLRDDKQPIVQQQSSIKIASQTIQKFFSFCKKRTKSNQMNGNQQHPIQPDNFNSQPSSNNSNMKIVFANSHCKRKFATSNLEFLQKNMNFLFSQSSISALGEISQGSSEEQQSKRKVSNAHQNGQSQENQQVCILQCIWDKFQQVNVSKSSQSKQKDDDDYWNNYNEEVHLNCIYKKNKTLVQEYENLIKLKQSNQKIFTERSNIINNSQNVQSNHKKDTTQNTLHNNKDAQHKKPLTLITKRESKTDQQPGSRNSEQHIIDSPSKTRKENEKKNFLFIPEEMRFDIKIVKCKWEEEVAVMVLLSDISQKVVIDRMRQVNSYKNEMLASITHNLKTPLNGVMLMIESAILSNSLHLAQKQLTLAQNNGRLLLYMINDLLDYSRLSTKKPFHLTFQQFHLDDLLFNIKSLLIQQFVSKNIKLQLEMFVTKTHQLLINDKIRIEQVLLNLCQNALKFTFNGYVKIIVFEDETRPNELFFKVQDSGLGISDQAKQNLFKIYGNMLINSKNKRHGKFIYKKDFNFQKIYLTQLYQIKFYEIQSIQFDEIQSIQFNPFQFDEIQSIQLDDIQTINCIKLGVGLGLAVCRKLVGQLGSQKVIQIESFKGKGSSFTFSIFRNHPLNQEEDIIIPQFRSLKYIQIKSTYQEGKALPHSSSLNSQFNGPGQDNIYPKARRNSVSNPKKSIHFEESDSIIKNAMHSEDVYLNQAQPNKINRKSKDQVINKSKSGMSSNSSSSSDLNENIFLDQLNNQSQNTKALINNYQSQVYKTIFQQNPLHNQTDKHGSMIEQHLKCSLDLIQNPAQLSQSYSEDNSFSEKKQQISIPQISTKTQENISSSKFILNENAILGCMQTRSDLTLLQNQSSLAKVLKKNRTILFQNSNYNINEISYQDNHHPIESKTELISSVISPIKQPQQQHTLPKYPYKSQTQNNLEEKQKEEEEEVDYDNNNKLICHQNNSFKHVSTQNLSLNIQQNQTAAKTRPFVLRDLNPPYFKEQEIIKKAINRTMNHHLDLQRDNIQINSTRKSNDISDQNNFAQNSTILNNTSLINLLNQLIWRKTNLLIVDDTIFNIMALKNILKNITNLHFEEAYNGQQAIEKVKQNKNYDLIFMDINMPVLDGFEATSIITKMIQNNEIPPATIIIVSAFNDEADRSRSFKLGAKAHIDKPVTLENIYKAIKTLKLPHLQIS